MSDEIPAKRRKLEEEPGLAEGCTETQHCSEDPKNEVPVDVPSCSGQNTTQYLKKTVTKVVCQQQIQLVVADKKNINTHQSCVLKDLQKTLIEYNLANNSKLTLGPLFRKENPDLDDFYVPPTLSQLLPKRKETESTSYESKPITSLEQLLNPLGKHKRFTCITSNAGFGKTSFCKLLARLWCGVKKDDKHLLEKFKAKADYLHDVEYLDKFGYLFYVSLKEVKCNTGNVEDIIFSHLLEDIDDTWDNVDKNRILRENLNKTNSLVILDGLDEMNISKFKTPLASRKYTLICTSRPWKLCELGMSTSEYMEIQLEEMNLESALKLIENANVCLNSQSAKKLDNVAFSTELKEQNLESLLSNPLSLQLLCIYHDRYDIHATGTSHFLLATTRTHLFANAVDMMLKLASEKEPDCFKTLSDRDKNRSDPPLLPTGFDCFKTLSDRDKNRSDPPLLPTGFDEADTCNSIPSFVLSLGELAFQDIKRKSETEMPERLVCQYLHDKDKKTEIRFLLASGLISGSASSRYSDNSMVYSFLHKMFQELLACVYISTKPLNSGEWGQFLSYFEKTLSPDIMSFLCVMNYEQGIKCAELFSSSKTLFYREGKYYEYDLISYQDAVLNAHKKCTSNGAQRTEIALNHMLIDRKTNKGPPCSLVEKNVKNIITLLLKSSETEKDLDAEFRENKLTSLRTLIITGDNDTLMLETLTEPSSGNLRILLIKDVELKQKQVDLTGCKYLTDIEVENVDFSSVDVKAGNLEKFWMYTKNKTQSNTPAELRIHGNFSSKLKKLSVMNVKLITPIDLSDCVYLQILVIQQITSSPEDNAKCFQNINHFTHLKSVQLVSLKYPDNITLDFSLLKDLERLIIENVEVEKIIIAAGKLSELWVYGCVPNANTIQPLIVTVAASSNFKNLEHLSLVHVELNGQLDLSQSTKLNKFIVRNVSSVEGMSVLKFLADCKELQELWIEALNSHENEELDMSKMTNLKRVYIDVQTLNVQTVKIPITKLEIFWAYVSKPKKQIPPPIKLCLLEHAQFTRTIKELSLENVRVNEADLSMCENLSKLRIDKISQSVVEKVCAYAVKKLYLVNVKEDRMAKLFEAKLGNLSKLSFERCEEQATLPIFKSASTLQTFKSVRFKNTRVENIVDQFAEIRVDEMEFEDMSLTDAALIDIAKRSKGLKCSIRKSTILSTNIEDAFDKLKKVGRITEGPIIIDSIVETSSHQIYYLKFETNH
ncbi:uncharacterized protein LOC128234001 [Mya arenaria]|nr:uncharacterized protein LOC128234001 [Mya arenaria]XP_052803892.1 uncharacterized protein LOC128234001 [Mya arenaria]XP_052803901.1 uncharacterized protein LOC128234001 [Mya arenaria]XP_052803909.1 uncharacterized protein LOC128234001 [Mya arenaria]XP_052803917.1 uncharacterized protein LOC128234001 [Mya arenaria]